jgi:hypothetical protein
MIELEPKPGTVGDREAAIGRRDGRASSTSSAAQASAKSLKCSRIHTFGVPAGRCRHAGAERPSKQLPDRHAERLAHQIPAGDLEGGQRGHGNLAGTAVLGDLEIPRQPVDVEGIGADDVPSSRTVSSYHGAPITVVCRSTILIAACWSSAVAPHVSGMAVFRRSAEAGGEAAVDWDGDAGDEAGVL